MTLVVHELAAAELYQELTPDRNIIVEAVRPHLYRHLLPIGSLKVKIYLTDGTLVAESDPVTITDIGSNNYFHGYVRFYINAGLQKDVTYRFYLVGSGYTFSESAYVGWCTGLDLGKYPADYIPETDLAYPLDIEVWERKTK